MGLPSARQAHLIFIATGMSCQYAQHQLTDGAEHT
jgi:hypothetical protein